MGDFYGTGIEIWAGFGPAFQVFIGKKEIQNIVAAALKSCIK